MLVSRSTVTSLEASSSVAGYVVFGENLWFLALCEEAQCSQSGSTQICGHDQIVVILK